MLTRSLFLIGSFWLVTTLVASPIAAGAGSSSETLRVARESQARWTIGAVRLRDKHGRARVQAELVAEGVIIAHVRLDPKTGEFTAGKVYADRVATEDLARLKAAGRALSQLEVGGWAWPAEHGRGWRVPLRYGGRVIGTVTVDVQRSRLIPKSEGHDEEGDE